MNICYYKCIYGIFRNTQAPVVVIAIKTAKVLACFTLFDLLPLIPSTLLLCLVTTRYGIVSLVDYSSLTCLLAVQYCWLAYSDHFHLQRSLANNWSALS